MTSISKEARFRTPNVAKEFDKFPQDKIDVWRNNEGETVAEIRDWEDFSLCNKQFHNYTCIKADVNYVKRNRNDDEDDEKCEDECVAGSCRSDYYEDAFIIITIDGVKYKINERFTDLYTDDKKLFIVF